MDAQALEDAHLGLQRVPAALAGHCFDQARQFHCGAQRLFFPCSDDCTGDPGGVLFLAIFFENTRQFSLGQCVHHHGGGQGLRPVHAHVQLRLLIETEAAGGIVQLVRGHAQIEDDPVYALDPAQRQFGAQPAEIAFYNIHPVPVSVKLLGSLGDGFLVLVEGEQPDLGLGFQQRQAMASAADCGIHIYPSRARCQELDALRCHYGEVELIHSL